MKQVVIGLLCCETGGDWSVVLCVVKQVVIGLLCCETGGDWSVVLLNRW